MAQLLHMTGDYQGGYDLLSPHVGDEAAHPMILFEFARLAAQHRRDDGAPTSLKNRRVVPTATIDQVRRPMYGSSVGRWRHFEQQLEPIMGMLSA